MATKKTKTASNGSKKSTRRKSTSRAANGATAKRSAKTRATNGKRSAAAAKPVVATPSVPTLRLNDEQRDKHIAVAAYFLAEQRAFAPNHELDDWLTAERTV